MNLEIPVKIGLFHKHFLFPLDVSQSPITSLFLHSRQGGDIIVIGLEKEAISQRGRVIAVLKAVELASYGSWEAKDFDLFYQSHEELGRLEICLRKRR
ncbi:Leucine-rich repeat serine/threonine-protein kinase 1, partial [Ophiophagus hannah]